MTDESMLRRFLDEQGRVAVWPSKPTHKQLVLVYLATKFAPGRTYTEKEVNEILKTWHTFGDWPLLRRGLVDAGFLGRDRGGYEYRLAGK